jgi:hypothetical protein
MWIEQVERLSVLQHSMGFDYASSMPSDGEAGISVNRLFVLGF